MSAILQLRREDQVEPDVAETALTPKAATAAQEIRLRSVNSEGDTGQARVFPRGNEDSPLDLQPAEQVQPDHAEAALGPEHDDLANLADTPNDPNVLDARHALGLPATTLAISRLLADGARLKVAAPAGKRPFYQLVDETSGNVTREWSQAAFVRLIRGVREDIGEDVSAGLILGCDK